MTLAFDNVTGEMMSEARDPALFPFQLTDETGTVAIKAVESKVDETNFFCLSR